MSIEAMKQALEGVASMARCGQLDAFIGEPWLNAVFAAISEAEKREWVGLTDEERFEVADISDCFEDVVDAVEAKLKEKNSGQI